MTAKESKDNKKKVKALEKELQSITEKSQAVEQEKLQLFEQLQRLSADYANFQKRTPKQIADSVAYEKKNILRSLLPSLDNFEHAFAGVKAAHSEEALQKTIDGIHLVYDHMLDALKGHGVKRIESAGQAFDPNMHEAMMQRAEEDKEDGIVLEEFQPGYMLNDQVLRPAKVIVNKLPAEEPASPAEETEQSEQTEEDKPEDQE